MNLLTGSLHVIGFFISILVTLVLLLLWFIVKRYQVVENNELLIVESWLPGRKKLRFISGGTCFVLPFFEVFSRKSLEPMELNIDLSRVMTKGNIPLGGKIFAQIVIDDTEPNVNNVAKHLSLRTRAQQIDACLEILNGVLRETVANLTPEQVLEDKETFKEEMLKNAVLSLGHLGFKIKTLNIQEVSDHVNDGTGYISQLMRPRRYTVDRDTRIEVSDAEAKKIIAQNEAHKSMKLQQLEQEKQALEAEMNYQIQQTTIEGDVKAKEIEADLEAELQEVLASLHTKTAELEAIRAKFEADHIQKAVARKEQLIEEGKAITASILESGMAEIKVLEEQLSILQAAGPDGLEAFLIDHYNDISQILTDTIKTAKFDEVNILEGSLASQGVSHPLNAPNIAALLEIMKLNNIQITPGKPVAH